METTTLRQGEFTLTCQHKLAKEYRAADNGGQKEVHVVIKQSSFVVVIVSEKTPLEECNVDCSLVYDNEEMTVCRHPH